MPLSFPDHFPRDPCRLVGVGLGMRRKKCGAAHFMIKLCLKNDLADCTDGEQGTRLRKSQGTQS